jgi:rSAM/selenodomain-associated transferase 2
MTSISPIRLSIIIPALNEAAGVGAAVSAARALPGPPEVIVVDGGSSDSTIAEARRHGAQIIAASCGRGSQMHAGALAATGQVLWFLHADTVPPADAVRYIAAALADDRVAAGNFEIRFDGGFTAARCLTWIYHHLARLGLRYGDSAYFVRRSDYLAVGGFRPFPIFEDLDLMRRLRRRGRFVRVPGVVTTSSRRFAGRSFILTFAHWTLLQLLYWLDASPPFLGTLYSHIREPGRRRCRDMPQGDRQHGPCDATAAEPH